MATPSCCGVLSRWQDSCQRQCGLDCALMEFGCTERARCSQEAPRKLEKRRQQRCRFDVLASLASDEPSGWTNVTAGPVGSDAASGGCDVYEAAAFVNWLNTSTGTKRRMTHDIQRAWSMTLWSSAQAWQAGGENLYRHKDAFYFCPARTNGIKPLSIRTMGVTAKLLGLRDGSNRSRQRSRRDGSRDRSLHRTVTPAAVDSTAG
jgi:hypothetical protein